MLLCCACDPQRPCIPNADIGIDASRLGHEKRQRISEVLSLRLPATLLIERELLGFDIEAPAQILRRVVGRMSVLRRKQPVIGRHSRFPGPAFLNRLLLLRS